MAVDRQQVSKWLEEAGVELGRLSREIESLVELRSRVERRVALLRELIGEEEAATATAVPPGLAASPSSDFRKALNDVLAQAGRPLHLTESRAALNERGIDVPGRGTDANIIAHLSRLPGVARVERGTYQIGGAVAEKSKPRRRRKKRRKTANKAG